ncbi:MAG: cation:proton antiporter [Candidatus Parvarchaeota archaeon]|nr:cation:proton antiporter [Candidatus Parvarchaeota archaeon]
MLSNETVAIYILGAAGIILIGFIGNTLAKRTRIPAIVWLVTFGIILGPLLGVISRNALVNISPLVSTVVLTVVLFNVGLRLNVYKSLKLMPAALKLALINFTLSAAVVMLIMMVFGYSPVYSLLFAFILGGSSVAIIPIISEQIRMKSSAKTLVTLEATLTDPIGIVLALAMISIILLSSYNVVTAASAIASEFSIGIVIGAVFGLIWIPAMGAIQRRKYEFSYVASLSMVFIVYLIANYLGGNGPLSALTFGIIIANGEVIYRALKYRHPHYFTLDKESKSFNNLITFIVTTFFFVYLGGLVTFSSTTFFIIGAIISVGLLLVRIAGTRLSLYKNKLGRRDMSDVSAMLSRGLGAAVLSTLPLEYGLMHVNAFIDVIFSVIFITIFINGILLYYNSRR